MERATSVWRLLPYDVGGSARHFVLSDALARHVVTPTVWWHSTRHPTVILGAGQDPGILNEAVLLQSGVSVVRRQAGGTAVYAGPDVLGLDVALPAGHPLVLPDIVESYRWLGEIWVSALRDLGAGVHLVSIEEAREGPRNKGPHDAIVTLACFGSLSPYEVTAGGRKLVGLAQVRRRTAELLQSAVHIRFDAAGLASLLTETDRDAVTGALDDAAVGLSAVVPATGEAGHLMDAFHAALQRDLSVTLEEGGWTDEELSHADLQLRTDSGRVVATP